MATLTDQGFAGNLTVDGNYFEWKRLIDFQPAGHHADVGSLRLAQADGIEQMRAMVDCEISFAAASATGFRIYASTLPFRVGHSLRGHLSDQWQLRNSEGAIADLGVR